jgi:poly-gamma-glutamate capsule biosynthesis protein CapA/YwtB (metallophosphatase superfamily)
MAASVTVALAGDTMLGRQVAVRIAEEGPRSLFSAELRDVVAEADLTVLNLECCVSERGEPWLPGTKAFHFRAPPAAVDTLTWLGVDCVTLANNHALDFGVDALLDTRAHLAAAGIRSVGAGGDLVEAREGAVLSTGDLRVAVLGVADHPTDFAAGPDRPGTAYADLDAGVPRWLVERVAELRDRADAVLVTPHWGPNMTAHPTPYVGAAARVLVDAGATLVAGHSAHVFHGVWGGTAPDGRCAPVLFDMGDFVDDYAVDEGLRNDLGLLFLVTLDARGPVRLDAVPLALGYCHTRLARDDEWAFVRDRFVDACAEFGTEVEQEGDRLAVHWR